MINLLSLVAGALLNDSVTQPASATSEENMELKEEVNDDMDDDNNLYVDESVDTDNDTELLLANGTRRLSSNSSGSGDKSLSSEGGLQGILMGPNHKKCEACGIIMLKKNFARHLRDMHTEPKPRSLCPLCQKSYKTSDWLKDHIRRGHGYTKELTDQLMATLKTPIKKSVSLLESPKDKVPPLLSLEHDPTRSKEITKEVNTKSLAVIDIERQPMTILNSLNIVKQESNIQT